MKQVKGEFAHYMKISQARYEADYAVNSANKSAIKKQIKIYELINRKFAFLSNLNKQRTDYPQYYQLIFINALWLVLISLRA